MLKGIEPEIFIGMFELFNKKDKSKSKIESPYWTSPTSNLIELLLIDVLFEEILVAKNFLSRL